MRPLSLQTRVVAALMASVAIVSAVLIVLTSFWGNSQYRDSVTSDVTLAMAEDMSDLKEAIGRHPSAGSRLELDIRRTDSHAPPTDRVLIPIESRTAQVDTTRAEQWGFTRTDLVADHPECLQPRRWEEHLSALIPYEVGSSISWTEECGGMTVGYGFTPTQPESELAGWMIVHAHTPDEGENSTPGVALAMIHAVAWILAVTWILGVLLADRIVSPVARTREMAEAVASGDLSARAPVIGRDELAQLSTAINTMADQLTAQIGELERSNEAQRQFVADVAHELRTPTAALLASAEALGNPATRDAAAIQVAPELRRLAGLTEDLLTISQMDAGRAVVVLDRVDIVDLTREAIADSARPDDVLLAAPDTAEVETDPTRLRVILRNLIANAQQHGAPPVTVTIDTRDEAMTITVQDAGDGVPASLADRVFDRFTRADTARHGASTGLGLAIARENARLLGGTLALAPDRTTFVLHLRDPAVTDRA